MSWSNSCSPRRVRIVTSLAPVAALSAALAACMAGPNYVAPAAPKSTTYTVDPLTNLRGSPSKLDSAIAGPGEWWSLLDSTRLDATIRQALRANRSLEGARRTLDRARDL